MKARVSQANQAYTQQLAATNKIRHEYYTVNLPGNLKVLQLCAASSVGLCWMVVALQGLKDSIEEGDMGLQYQLANYAYHFESAMLADGTALRPIEETGRVVHGLPSEIAGV